MEPTVAEGLLRRLGVAGITEEDVWTFDQDLSIAGDLHLDAVERAADGSDLTAAEMVEARRPAVLGLPVHVGDRDPEREHPIARRHRERRRSGDQNPCRIEP